MKIEVGKFYKTRSNEKARIYATIDDKTHLVHGAVLDKQRDAWISAVWLENGSYPYSRESADDIVSELEEPKPRLLAWVRIIGGDVLFVPEGKEEEYFGDISKYRRMPHLDEPETET